MSRCDWSLVVVSTSFYNDLSTIQPPLNWREKVEKLYIFVFNLVLYILGAFLMNQLFHSRCWT